MGGFQETYCFALPRLNETWQGFQNENLCGMTQHDQPKSRASASSSGEGEIKADRGHERKRERERERERKRERERARRAVRMPSCALSTN